jgi:hypothetical protein
MANVSVIKLKVRRGTDVQRQLVTLDQGEIGYTTDSKRLFVGDGSTAGGNSAGIKFYTGVISSATAGDCNISTAQVGDIVFDSACNLYYILSGGSYNNYASYRPVQQINSSYTFAGPYKYSTGVGGVIPVSGTNTSSGNYGTIAGGNSNCTFITASASFIGGGTANWTLSSCSGIGAGTQNKNCGRGSFIGGGCFNTINCCSSFIGAGCNNKTFDVASTVVTGNVNCTLSGFSFIGSGCNNITACAYSNIVGGICNCTGCAYSNVVGGQCNRGLGYTSSVVGGICNTTNSVYNSIVGGCCNVTSGTMSTIVGGFSGLNTGNYSYIGNGVCNSASGCYGVIVGGFKSTNSAGYAFIGGGQCNYIAPTTANFSSVVGGAKNCNYASCSFIGGGATNCITGNLGFIGAGCGNIASGALSFVAGGSANNTKGFTNTFILGSNLSAASANYTYVNNISSQGAIYGNAVNVTNGFYSTSSFNGSYTDGVVVDYVTGQGRISVGPLDSLTFFNGGPATTATMTISTNGYTTFSNSVSANNNIYAGGNVFGGTNINVINGTSYTIQLSDNGGTIASTNNTSGLTALVNNTGYPVGFQTAVIQLSTARVAVSGNGFSVNQSNSFYKTTKQYSAATLVYTGSIGGWVLFGDVSV